VANVVLDIESQRRKMHFMTPCKSRAIADHRLERDDMYQCSSVFCFSTSLPDVKDRAHVKGWLCSHCRNQTAFSAMMSETIDAPSIYYVRLQCFAFVVDSYFQETSQEERVVDFRMENYGCVPPLR